MAPKKPIINDSSADELKQTKPKSKSKKVAEPEPTQNSDLEKESPIIIDEPKISKPKAPAKSRSKSKAIKPDSETEHIEPEPEPEPEPKSKAKTKVSKTDSEQEPVQPKPKAAPKSKKTKNNIECELFTESVDSAVKQLEKLKSDTINSSKPEDIEKELEISKSNWLQIQNKIDSINSQVESIEREKDEVLKHLTDLLDLLKEETEPNDKSFSLDKKINVNNTKFDKNIIPITNSDSSSDSSSDSDSDSDSDSEVKSKILAPPKGKKTAAKGKAVIKKKVAISSDSNDSESE